ncbi:hypothetical protein PMSD_10310 [Paenibacillus macquariensis subsp. defensor]|nr:hypothetical protein PMSD_10310 [Paenibacillus macquariensis subsp. defensor]
MKRSQLYLISLVVLLLSAIFTSIITASSFNNDVDLDNHLDREDILLNLEESENYISIYFNNKIDSIEELVNQSKFILKVKATKKRTNFSRSIHTAVQVLELYKGDGITTGSEIYIYEPSYFFGSNYLSFGGYQIMEEGEEYIVFLDHLQVPDNYKYKGNEAISFLPISTYFGKFPTNQVDTNDQILTKNETDNGVNYTKINNWDIITTNKEISAFYNKLKQLVFLKYK